MNMEKDKGVRTQHPDYIKNSPLWKKCNDAAEGEHVIHAAGETYLPRLAEELDADYEARKARTPFFNATWRTISGLKGMLFRKAPTYELAAAVKAYADDIDLAGTPLDMFAQEISEEVLKPGRVGILVDRPPIPSDQVLTVAQAERLGLRPTMQKYEASSIINWKYGRVNNAYVLVMVVLAESSAVGEEEFAHTTEDRYRVLDLVDGKYRQRLFMYEDGKDVQIDGDIFPQMNGKPLTYIPFIFLGVNDLSANIDTPPLLDLVCMNVHHYQVSADFEHGCHYSGLPTLFITGHRGGDDDDKIYIGGPTANVLSDPNSQAFYAEVAGHFDALQKNLESKKGEMAVLGARMLENQKAAVESHETLSHRTQGEQSQLAAMAVVISMGLEKALGIFSEWAGGGEKVEYKLNTDFIPNSMSSQDLTALVAAWQSGMPGASDQNVYKIMQDREMADPAITFEEEQERISTRTPQLMV